MQTKPVSLPGAMLLLAAIIFISYSCQREGNMLLNQEETETSNSPILLVIDEESIDNGNEPNDFSNVEVNDQLAKVGLREQLRFFRENVGRTITLYTGQVGDEGWHALKTIPNTWKNAGPFSNGSRNFLKAGPGLGSGNPDDDKEVLLDKIPDVTPLRATGLTMLKRQTILAIVYDSDISINYSPLLGNLMGANLGIVAFEVLDIKKRTDGSTSSLPAVTIRIRNADDFDGSSLQLFQNAPVPRSSSEPFDINPPASAPAINLVAAE